MNIAVDNEPETFTSGPDGTFTVTAKCDGSVKAVLPARPLCEVWSKNENDISLVQEHSTAEVVVDPFTPQLQYTFTSTSTGAGISNQDVIIYYDGQNNTLTTDVAGQVTFEVPCQDRVSFVETELECMTGSLTLNEGDINTLAQQSSASAAAGMNPSVPEMSPMTCFNHRSIQSDCRIHHV